MKSPVHVPGESFVLRDMGLRARLTPCAEVLSAPFVGSDLTATPGSSSFGTLSRLIRLNELPRVALSSLFAIRTRRSDDLSSVMTFSEARQVSLAKALNLSDVPREWNLSTWFPFRAPSMLLATDWAFRYCPTCLRSGYHTPLHQLPWVVTCPWHNQPLLGTCEKCGRRIDTGADWAIGCNLGCECGHVPMDTDAALYAIDPPQGAMEYLVDYREWADAARTSTKLIAPERSGDPRPALATLVQLPKALMSGIGACATFRAAGAAGHARLHCRTLTTARSAPATDREGLLRFDELRQDRPGFLTTPERLVPIVTAIAARLALRLPARSLTDSEMSLFLAGAGVEAPATFVPATRQFSAELSMLPPSLLGERHFLNLTCIHPTAYRVIPGLFDAVLEGRTAFDFYAQATPTELDLLMRACGSVLGRGYAEGLRSTLATHLPEMYAMPRDAPRLTQPWVLIKRAADRVVSIRLAWTPLRCAPMGAGAILAAEDQANLRRQRARRGTKARAK